MSVVAIWARWVLEGGEGLKQGQEDKYLQEDEYLVERDAGKDNA